MVKISKKFNDEWQILSTKCAGTTAYLYGKKNEPQPIPYTRQKIIQDHTTERKSFKSLKVLWGNLGHYLCEFGADKVSNVCKSYLNFRSY